MSRHYLDPGPGRSGIRVYLAGQYPRRAELARYAAELRQRGITVTSRWLDTETEADLESATWEQRETWAANDLEDVDAADVVVVFTETASYGPTRGGRHVETGFALARRKVIILVGPLENVFHSHPDISARFREWGPAVVDVIPSAWAAEKRRQA